LQIKDGPVNSAAEALTGRLAGVQVTSAEGTPGNNNVQIRIRGGGSVTQDYSPLYVVDGVQIENALSVIAPQDIANVDVLKDAATAIYGARGANGVVIITTKNGREGRTVISYSGFAGVRQLTRKLDLMQPADFVNYQYERAVNTNTLPAYKAFFGSRNYTGDTLNQARSLPFLDWQEQVFERDAYQQTHNISLAGGSKNSNSAVRLRNVNQYLPLALTLPGALAPGVFDPTFYSAPNLSNPLIAIENDYQRNKLRNLNLGGNVSFNITKDLIFRSTVGFDVVELPQERFSGRYSPAILAPSGPYQNLPFAGINTSRQTTVNNSNVLTYALRKGKHSLDALLGEEIYQQLTTPNVQTYFLLLNITAERAIANINQGVLPNPTTGIGAESRLLSGFGRLSGCINGCEKMVVM